MQFNETVTGYIDLDEYEQLALATLGTATIERPSADDMVSLRGYYLATNDPKFVAQVVSVEFGEQTDLVTLAAVRS